MNGDFFCSCLIAAVIGLVFYLSFLMLPDYSLPVYGRDVDYEFHLDFARAYINGSYPVFNSQLMSLNPYPPLFHFILAPVVLAHCEVGCGLTMKFLFWPLALLSSTLLSLKMFDTRIALVVLASLLLSPSFFDRTYQPIPQALDFILLPVMIWSYLKDSRWFYLALVPIYAHGIVGLLLFLPFLIHSVVYRNARMPLRVLVVSIPVILLTAWYFFPAVHVHSGFIDYLKFYYYQHPLALVPYMGIPFLFIPMVPLLKLGRENILLLLVLGSMMLMLPLWVERFFQYATIPLVLTAGAFIFERKGELGVSFRRKETREFIPERNVVSPVGRGLSRYGRCGRQNRAPAP